MSPETMTSLNVDQSYPSFTPVTSTLSEQVKQSLTLVD